MTALDIMWAFDLGLVAFAVLGLLLIPFLD